MERRLDRTRPIRLGGAGGRVDASPPNWIRFSRSREGQMRAIASEAEAEAPAEPGFSKPESLRGGGSTSTSAAACSAAESPAQTTLAGGYGNRRRLRRQPHAGARGAGCASCTSGHLVGTTRRLRHPCPVPFGRCARDLRDPPVASNRAPPPLAARDLTPAAAAALEAALADARRPLRGGGCGGADLGQHRLPRRLASGRYATPGWPPLSPASPTRCRWCGWPPYATPPRAAWCSPG